MEELLFGLTPAEWWAWSYLLLLAKRQGSSHVILPRPGADIEAEKIFSRKHIKNLLKSLKAKRHLTQVIIPRSKSQKIEVFLPASKIGELGFPNLEKGCLEFPNKGSLGNPSSAIKPLGNCSSSIEPDGQCTLAISPPHKLSLKEVINKLVKLKQGDLKGELARMATQDLEVLIGGLEQIMRIRPKSQSLSLSARAFAMVRYLQNGEPIKPQAWIDTVARQVDQELREGAWSERSSGNGGRLPSLSVSEFF